MRIWMKEGSAQQRSAQLRPALALGTLLTFCLPIIWHSAPADAATATSAQKKPVAPVQTNAKPVLPAKLTSAKLSSAMGKRSALAIQSPHATSKNPALKTSKVAYAPRSAGISCVPYARAVTGIDVKGNAAAWWDNAAGQYERGSNPEAGAVMNFRATGRMRLGHVAVVTRVMDSRTVEIDHANWWGPGATKGGVSRGIPVVDVSENNDWSAVRVGLGHTGDYGSVYPTYGFIYGRPDRGGMLVNATLRRYTEVAEAPAANRLRDADVIHREIR